MKEELDTLLLEIDLKANLDRIDQLENEQANLSKGEKVWYVNKSRERSCELPIN